MKRVVLAAVAVMMAVQIGVQAQSKPKTMSTTGTVKTVSADSLSITSGAKDMTIALDSSTKFVGKGLTTKSGGAPMKATDAVAAGDRVRVDYHDQGGTMHASQVTITQKAAAAKK
jgi:hypothetical protein